MFFMYLKIEGSGFEYIVKKFKSLKNDNSYLNFDSQKVSSHVIALLELCGYKRNICG